MPADGNGDLARQLGVEFDGPEFGGGMRSRRHSRLVEKGVVKRFNLAENGFERHRAQFNSTSSKASQVGSEHPNTAISAMAGPEKALRHALDVPGRRGPTRNYEWQRASNRV